MATTARDPAKFSLSAHAEERFFAPLRRRSLRARTGFFSLVGVVLLIHAVVLGYLLYRDTTTPFPVLVETETPVEVVVEPPPPPPPPKPEPQQQKPPPPPPKPPAEMEKPATSAPRVSKEQSKAKAADEKTAARKRAAPREGQPEPAKDSAAQEQPPTPEQKEAAAKLEDDKRDAEALDKATPDPAKTPDAPQPKTKPKPPVKTPADAVRQLSDLSDKPDDTLSNAGKMQPFPEGTEDNRYLAVVYGMVMSKNRYPGSSAERRHASGIVSVVFVVDPFGQVRHQEVVKSSGQADLDALAMGAVRSAGPFPPPPGSGPQQLVATMTFGGRSAP